MLRLVASFLPYPITHQASARVLVVLPPSHRAAAVPALGFLHSDWRLDHKLQTEDEEETTRGPPGVRTPLN